MPSRRLSFTVDIATLKVVVNYGQPITLSDGRYYTKAQANALLAEKSDVGHTHPISDVDDLQETLDEKLDKNTAISSGTHTKITYDADGLVTGGSNATTADIAASTDKNYVTDAEKTKLANTSGNNSGDQNASQVSFTPSGNTSSNNVQSAIQEIQGDVDAINTTLADLTAAVVLKGTWDPASGVFPGLGAAKAGRAYIVSAGGSMGGITFDVGDRVIAITNNASTSIFANNWFKEDYTDLVLSVNGMTGAVTITKSTIGLGNVDNTSDANKPVSTAQQTALDLKVSKATAQTDFISGVIAAPDNMDYKILVKAPYAGTITSTTTICSAGTATATFKIENVALGGTANAVSTVEQSQAQSSANSFAVGDDISVTISSVSGCSNIAFTIAFTRVLA